MRLLIGFIVALSALGTWAGDPVAGDSREKVIEELGNPQGRMNVGKNEVLFYDRGTIELTDGKVRVVKFISEEKLVAQQTAAAQKAKLEDEQRQKLIEEGTAEKMATLADPEFAKKSPSEQLGYWKEFAAKYPGVNITDVSKDARQAVELEAQKKADAERAAAIAKQKEQQPPPKLSASKLRKAYRTKTKEADAAQP